MAVRGAQAKNEITQKILETFKGSFVYNDGKEIRINWIEDGSPVQIKAVLTASKTPVNLDETQDNSDSSVNLSFEEKSEKIPTEPSDEEKERLERLMKSLGL